MKIRTNNISLTFSQVPPHEGVGWSHGRVNTKIIIIYKQKQKQK